MTFKLGDRKPAGSGRKRGTPNRQTELVRAGTRSAIQICQQDGDDPISIMVNASRFLNTVAAAFAPRAQSQASPAEIAAAVRAVEKGDLEFMRRFLVDAATIAHKAAEFGHPKLARIDNAGEIPGAQMVENKMVFVLNIDDGQRPGRPVNGRGVDGQGERPNTTDHGNRNRKPRPI
jgi:hypothetical protein